jgi:hypothetical protein
MPWELIICLLNVLKINFGDVDVAIFHHVKKQFEWIFYILGIHKNDLDEVAIVMFEVGECSWELIICPLDVL